MDELKQWRAEVFNDTRELSWSKYKQGTRELIESTVVIKEPLSTKAISSGLNEIHFIEGDTVSTIISSVNDGYKVCALNFADAVKPGGLVFEGAGTQEEDLCRCSNLFESLINGDCPENYYHHNTACGSTNFTDRLIYSKGVTVFKNSTNYQELTQPVSCEIVTCPAPIRYYISDDSVYYSIIKKRILGIVNTIAIYGNVNAVVFGAWGCGAFGGDARLVGKAFSEALANIALGAKVVFSVKPSEIEGSRNFERLYDGFYS